MSHSPTPFKYLCPLRAAKPADPIHPYLHEVNIDDSVIRSMINVTNGDTPKADVYNRKSFLELNSLIESNQAAPRAARSASDEIDRWLDSLDGDALHFVVEFLSDDDEVSHA